MILFPTEPLNNFYTVGNSFASIADCVFSGCNSLKSIKFDSLLIKWDTIVKGADWDINTGEYTIYCTDGEIAKDGTITYK